jgi:hypothetical protein
MANATGRVVQILGGVVDVEFPEGDIPDLFEAIEVERPKNVPLILEVQNHIGDNWVRTVAMDATDGLQRGMPAKATGAPIIPRWRIMGVFSTCWKTGGWEGNGNATRCDPSPGPVLGRLRAGNFETKLR